MVVVTKGNQVKLFSPPALATCKELMSMVFHSAKILVSSIREHPDI